MNGLQKKAGPLPVWAWALLAGGSIGAIILIKKSKAAGTGEPESLSGQAGQAIPMEGSGGGGGAGASEIAGAKAENELLREALRESGGHGGALGQGISEVLEAREGLRALGLIPPESTTRTNASSESASAHKNAQGKFPLKSSRGDYRAGTYLGKSVHIYQHPVRGGVGPKGNMIVLGGPTKPTHAAQGDHSGAPSIVAQKPQPAAPAFTLKSSRGDYRPVTYRGKAAHEYAHAVAGGVGPRKNLIIA